MHSDYSIIINKSTDALVRQVDSILYRPQLWLAYKFNTLKIIILIATIFTLFSPVHVKLDSVPPESAAVRIQFQFPVNGSPHTVLVSCQWQSAYSFTFLSMAVRIQFQFPVNGSPHSVSLSCQWQSGYSFSFLSMAVCIQFQFPVNGSPHTVSLSCQWQSAGNQYAVC